MKNDGFKPLNFVEKSEEEMIASSRKFYETVKKRRTVRDFSDRPIPDEVIKNAILAAGTAPNGANVQPWKFVVVRNQQVKSAIRKAAEAEEKKFYGERASQEWLDDLKSLGTNFSKPFLEKTPCLIVVFLESYKIDKNGEKHKTYYPSESVGLATGTLINALHSSGLGTLTYTPSPMGFLKKILKRPENERPYMVLVTGYPAENVTVPNIEKLPLEEIAVFVD